MRVFQLCRELWLPKPREQVFPFFADANNLERLTPPWLCFSMLTSKTIEMRAGTRIDYRLSIHGVRIPWQSEITVWEPPHRFVDVQRRGPYRHWMHEHTFLDEGHGTRMSDLIHYAVIGGFLVNKLFVSNLLKSVFNYRMGVLRQLFASKDGSTKSEWYSCPP